MYQYKTSSFPAGRPLLLPLLLAFCFSCAFAQADTVLPVVTISADLPPAPTLDSIDQARKRTHATPGGVNVVDAAQYKEGRVSTLPDALRFSPGVFVASRFGAEEARLSIRGSGLQRTFHLRGIALLQDGVPLNLADGSADFQAVEPLSARYVEVYRGANALQFGAATLGGAVHFVSPSGLTAPPFAARVEAGSYGYKRAQVAAAGASDSLDWFIAGSAFFQKGFRAHARQDTQRVSGNLGWRIDHAGETRFFLQAAKSNSELPGALTKAEMLATPRKADPAAVWGDQHRDFDLVRLSNKTSVRLDAAQRLEFGGFYAMKSLFHPIFQVLEQDSDDYGFSGRWIVEGVLFGHQNQLTLGVSFAQGLLDDDRFTNVNGARGVRTGLSRQRSANTVIYAENQHRLRQTTGLVLGAQAVRAERVLNDQFLTNGDNSVDSTFRHVSPKFGIREDVAPDIQMFANLSGSYEPPTFGELAGGPNVRPVTAQRGRTAEVGTRGLARLLWGTLRWDVALYRARLKNELLSLNDAAGNPLGTRNAERTIHQGVEAGAELDVGATWTVRAAYQRNDFRFDNDRVYGKNRLAGAPRQIVTAELLHKPGRGLYFGPSLQLSSSSYVDHANTLESAGYGVAGFKIGQQVDRNLSWFIDARNLVDKVYAATTGVIADARGADSRQFNPGDGRSVFAGVELKY